VFAKQVPFTAEQAAAFQFVDFRLAMLRAAKPAHFPSAVLYRDWFKRCEEGQKL